MHARLWRGRLGPSPALPPASHLPTSRPAWLRLRSTRLRESVDSRARARGPCLAPSTRCACTSAPASAHE
eukprot:6204895-Pleurochrysis_carterae.AAC.1